MLKSYKRSYVQASKASLSIRAINSWNGLPEHVVTARSLNAAEFKSNLDDFLSEQFFDY